MADYISAWQEWEILWARRNKNPVDAMKEYLRCEGWIVERPETLSLPVKVARSGGFTEQDGYAIKLHVRAAIGDRLMQVDHMIDRRYADMPAKAFTGAIGSKFTRAIMAELEPQIEAGCQREIARALEEDRE